MIQWERVFQQMVLKQQGICTNRDLILSTKSVQWGMDLKVKTNFWKLGFGKEFLGHKKHEP